MTANPASAMAQVAALASADLNDPLDTNLQNTGQVEAIQPDSAATSASGNNQLRGDRITKPRQLTFQLLNQDTNDVVAFNVDIAQSKVSHRKSGKAATTKAQVTKAQVTKAQVTKAQVTKAQVTKAQVTKGYCTVFFQGVVSSGTAFTAVGSFSSSTLIEIFDDEAAYRSGSSVLQTIEYHASSSQLFSAGDQFGSLTLTNYQDRELTFQYLSTTDTNYTDTVIHQTGNQAVVNGILDDDNEVYIVVIDGKGGNKCRTFKQYQQCKGSNHKGVMTIAPGIAPGNGVLQDCSSETLVHIFDNDTQVVFTDVSTSYWASTFIYRLVTIQVIQGFPGGIFRPEDTLTNAQFAAILSSAFHSSSVRQSVTIRNVSSSYWAYSAIQQAYSMGFIDIRDNTFNVDQNLTKLDVLVAIAKGLGYTQVSSGRSVDDILVGFTDTNAIPSEYRSYIAALIEKGVLVNYPNVSTLNLDQPISRAETCALVYQALVSLGQVESVDSAYIAQ
jgi:hypothetical protein